MKKRKAGRPKRIGPIDGKFGEKLKMLRKAHKMTQKQIADYLNISTDTVRGWENGRSLPNNTKYYITLADLFHVSCYWLMESQMADDILHDVKGIFDSFRSNGARKEETMPIGASFYSYPLQDVDIKEIKDLSRFTAYLEETMKNAIDVYMKTLN